MKKAIIIGNGPAGISAAIYTARANIDTQVIGSDTGALKTATVENYYGFPEPITGEELIKRGISQAKRLGASITTDEVLEITFHKTDDSGKPLYLVKTVESEYLANAVVIAVGQKRKKSQIKNLDELEGQGVSYCAVCDGFFYRGKDVCVIGAGKYALNEVSALLPLVNSVTLLTNGIKPSADFPDSVKVVKSKITSLNKNSESAAFSSVSFEDGSTLDFAGAFIAEGSADSLSLAKKLGIFTQKNKITVSEKKETNLPGIYAAGDCTGGILQIAKAVSDGMTAGISISQYLQR